MGTPGSQICNFLPKMTPNIDIMLKSFQLGHYIMHSNHKNTFRSNLDTISAI